MSVEERIIICAVRYALGRRTYIVDGVCGYVASKKDSLSEKCLTIIINDIEEEIELLHRIGRTCGDGCDEWEWKKLLKILKGE